MLNIADATVEDRGAQKNRRSDAQHPFCSTKHVPDCRSLPQPRKMLQLNKLKDVLATAGCSFSKNRMTMRQALLAVKYCGMA